MIESLTRNWWVQLIRGALAIALGATALASPTTGMTHMALQEHVDGQVANWMEQVTDAQYAGASSR